MKFKIIFLLFLMSICAQTFTVEFMENLQGVDRELQLNQLGHLKNPPVNYINPNLNERENLEKEDLEFLVRIQKENLLVYPNTEIPILNFCVYKGYHHCVKYLLDNQIIGDLNVLFNHYTLLGEAILWFELTPKIYGTIIKMLLSANADPNKYDPLRLILKKTNKNARESLLKLFFKYKIEIKDNHFELVIEKELIEEMIFFMKYAEIAEEQLIKILHHSNKNILYAIAEFKNGYYLEKLLKIAKMKKQDQQLNAAQRSELFAREKYLESLINYKSSFKKETAILSDLIAHSQVITPIILEYCQDSEEEIFVFLLDKYKNGFYEIVKKTLMPLPKKDSYFLSEFEKREVQHKNLSRKKIWRLHIDADINQYFNNILHGNLESPRSEYNEYHDNFFGWTPLMWSAFVGKREITETILSTCKTEDFIKQINLVQNTSTIAKLFGNYEIHEMIEQAMKEKFVLNASNGHDLGTQVDRNDIWR